MQWPERSGLVNASLDDTQGLSVPRADPRFLSGFGGGEIRGIRFAPACIRRLARA